MALSSTMLMTLCLHLAQSLKIQIFSKLHLQYDLYMYFNSILRLPAFSPVTNMTYNKAAMERQQA